MLALTIYNRVRETIEKETIMKLLSVLILLTSFTSIAGDGVSKTLFEIKDKQSQSKLSFVCEKFVKYSWAKNSTCNKMKIVLDENGSQTTLTTYDYPDFAYKMKYREDAQTAGYKVNQVGNKVFAGVNYAAEAGAQHGVLLLALTGLVTVPVGAVVSAPIYMVGLPMRAFEYIFNTNDPDLIKKLYKKSLKKIAKGKPQILEKKVKTARFDEMVEFFSKEGLKKLEDELKVASATSQISQSELALSDLGRNVAKDIQPIHREEASSHQKVIAE